MCTEIFNFLFHCGSDNLRKDYFEYSGKNLLVYVLCMILVSYVKVTVLILNMYFNVVRYYI